ncbi:hypothetical protein AVEN_76780-1 [Araneus ventricosus]|uniref:Uncharacterized protein n=1 Tax=Araneus ventricosus TaxID=182803 RepID=A0A4Y2QET0_ARAVE|nr:hypothetical protein AVEN_76780-1 [Araneus ventricosus]
MVTVNRVTPFLPTHPGTLNDSSKNRSNTEAGVVVAISGHVLSPPVGGTYYHWRGELVEKFTSEKRKTSAIVTEYNRKAHHSEEKHGSERKMGSPASLRGCLSISRTRLAPTKTRQVSRRLKGYNVSPVKL